MAFDPIFLSFCRPSFESKFPLKKKKKKRMKWRIVGVIFGAICQINPLIKYIS